MNERMREPFYTLMWKASIGYNDSWSQIDPEVLEKFAELIVTECVTLIRDMGNPTYINHSDWQVSRNDAMRVIREHFGVEE